MEPGISFRRHNSLPVIPSSSIKEGPASEAWNAGIPLVIMNPESLSAAMCKPDRKEYVNMDSGVEQSASTLLASDETSNDRALAAGCLQSDTSFLHNIFD